MKYAVNAVLVVSFAVAGYASSYVSAVSDPVEVVFLPVASEILSTAAELRSLHKGRSNASPIDRTKREALVLIVR